MNIKVKNFRQYPSDTARVVLFQLAALTADYFLLWPRRDASPVKMAVNGVCALLLHGLAYKAAKQFDAGKSETNNDNKNAQTPDDPNALVRPATP